MNGAALRSLNPLAPWVLFVLVVWLCWQLAHLFWLVVAPPQAPILREVALQSASGNQVPNITGFSLFTEQRPEIPTGQTLDSSALNVPVQLEGVFVSALGSRGAALIRVNNLSKHYRVGQMLDGAPLRLQAVAWDHIMLQRPDGSAAKLKFGQEGLDPISNAPVQNGANFAANNSVNNAQQVDTMLSEAIGQLTNNPAGYLSRMGVMATNRGYEITNSVPDNIRAQLGLKAGDRLVSLNGQTLGQPQSDALLLEQVRQQRRAQIEIQRGEQTMTIQQSF